MTRAKLAPERAVTGPGRLGCMLCLQLSAVIEGPAGDEAVIVRCELCGLPVILPASEEVVARVRIMYQPVPEAPAPAPVSPAEGCMADGPA